MGLKARLALVRSLIPSLSSLIHTERSAPMTSTTAAEPLPRWNMSNIYTALEGADYQAAVARLEAELSRWEEFLDGHGIRRLQAAPHGEAAALAPTLAAALRLANDVGRLIETLDAFVYAFLTTDSY